jgi:hypothetical protein
MENTETLFKELLKQTKHVRSLQKQYFTTKSKAVLSSAKTYETDLDQLIFKIDKKLEAKRK